ncbi:Protein of unknown function [Caldanaerovirga acetigignens]|uniref:DUF445 domain-containing protein n=1 Tax=Caldanaerovirga acetigignens TaxID=447595 RepID=A0A1M7G6W5_9FIRM|nr:DUF445 family protein [Caldanaerovirga acetigignens]SHM11667.1 Protein of unknown function [Caldanaerovirga acetigignens]
MKEILPILQLVFMPLIGAFIGWQTNVLAIRLIFRPLKPVRILGVEFQGLIPKRRRELAKNIGEVLEREIICSDDIINRLTAEEIKFQILSRIKDILEQKINEKLLYLPNTFKAAVANFLLDAVDRNGEIVYEELKKDFTAKVKEKFKLGSMVEEKLNSLDLKQLEELIVKLSKKELRQIELLGGVIGFFIGFVQAIFLHFAR